MILVACPRPISTKHYYYAPTPLGEVMSDILEFNKSPCSGMEIEFTHKKNCWKCEKEILVYSGSSPMESNISVHDIIRMGVCYTYRYVKSAKTKNKYFWMNVCPYCDSSQKREDIRALR